MCSFHMSLRRSHQSPCRQSDLLLGDVCRCFDCIVSDPVRRLWDLEEQSVTPPVMAPRPKQGCPGCTSLGRGWALGESF